MKHRVILIKSVSDENTSSCCSGTGSESGDNKEDRFKALYTYIKESCSDSIDLDVLDPRNSFLTFILIKDFFRFQVPIIKSLKTLFGYSVPSIIINGTLVFNKLPTIDEFNKIKIKGINLNI